MEGTSSSSTKHDDDDDDAVEIFPISDDDEKYAEEIQLQEALTFSSAISNTNKEIQVIDLEIDNVNDTHLRKLKLKEKETFKGESSSSSSRLKQISYCGICMEAKSNEEMFENRNCSHSFCEDCVGLYLAAKIQENISMVKCPDPKCNGILEPHNCISIIPKDVFDRWGNALCENMVIGSQKFYCPFNDCSAMLMNDEVEAVTVAECPHCHRLFCAQCKVSWHAGVDCREFQSLKDGERGREDLMAMELAKNKRWKRCPKCSYYVEKSDGCTRISCRYRQLCFV
ncbi:E3 ubiquitin-protein ligase RSL1-like [Trifolium pratense]|uniref:E3 ubiquitin-protein ligase RSL1-like n=1 Tax=Trifolium pratense TaxID=57577 RepID=UPI001E69212C|nr:E3 ubiquitin-protein ligase RSL1-like [Trifolium pratense]